MRKAAKLSKSSPDVVYLRKQLRKNTLTCTEDARDIWEDLKVGLRVTSSKSYASVGVILQRNSTRKQVKNNQVR